MSATQAAETAAETSAVPGWLRERDEVGLRGRQVDSDLMLDLRRHRTSGLTAGWYPQPVPEDVSQVLVNLRTVALGAGSPDERGYAWGRFLGYVAALKLAGWRERSLSEHLGLSHETIRQVRLKYQAGPADPAWPVPPGPQRPPPPPKEPRRKYLTAEQIAELNELRERSQLRGPVVGTERENDPAWLAGREFAARVAHLLDHGYTTYGIAADLGIRVLAIKNRLARHGYRKFSPSQMPSWARTETAS